MGKIRFDPKWIDPLLNGEKEATIRYKPDGLPSGYEYLSNAETNEVFAMAEIGVCRYVNVNSAINIIEKYGYKYPQNNTKILIESLRKYYPQIKQDDIVAVIMFEEIYNAK